MATEIRQKVRHSNQWTVHCVTCGSLRQAPNGAMMEAFAKEHAERNFHTVILGNVYVPICELCDADLNHEGDCMNVECGIKFRVI